MRRTIRGSEFLGQGAHPRDACTLSVFNHRPANNRVPTHCAEVQNWAARSLVWEALVLRSNRINGPVFLNENRERRVVRSKWAAGEQMVSIVGGQSDTTTVTL